jgi:hypothetical protein
MPRILVATRDGLHSIDDVARPPGFVGRSVNAIARDGAELWAIVDRAEIWHAPAEDDWRLVTTMDGLEATCLAMTDALHVGSSQAHLFRLAGDALELVSSFDDAEGRSEWFTPWGGPPATRSMTEWDEDVYVNVHVGGIVHTADGGRSWSPTIDIDADVHQVATAEGSVLAACAGGLATSTDRGSTWTVRSDGLDAAYSRAVSVCGATVLVSASNGPRGGRAAVYRGDVGAGPFERCTTGLPGWFDDNIDTYCLDALNDGTFAAFGTSDGRLFGSDDAGATWQQRAADLGQIHHVLVLPDWG